MKNDFDFIKDKLEGEGVNAPEALSEEKIMQSLNNSEGGNTVIPFRKKQNGFKAALALVACFAVIAVSVTFINKGNEKPPVAPTVETEAASIDGIITFESYEELEKVVKKMENKNKYSLGGIVKNFAASDSKSVAATEGAVEKNVGGGAVSNDRSESFAQTNKQVDSVDEADIIKTDGKYIYYINDMQSRILIYSAKDGKTKRLSVIESEGDNAYFTEMFIYGDKLIVIGTRSEYEELESETENEDAEESELIDGVFYNHYNYESYSFVYTYDISDRSKPVLKDKYEQSGGYNSSRMIGSCVYIISNYNRFYYGYKGGFVPCTYGNDGEKKKLAINDIAAVKDSEDASYSLIGAIDVEGGEKAKATKAVLGANEQVYCNESNLYLTGTYFGGKTEWTRIIKYSLNKTNIELKASGDAKGSVNDQFSLDEYNGNLRIALTDYRWGDGKDKNYLYILNDKLEVIGKTESFAKNEHIEAVRFMGDTAYVITYEQTDPLFIIDLSKPEEPKISGEVKIDGFSSFLTPVDENTMLGIGFATKEEEWGIVQDGLKLALFDVSDKKNPKVLDEYEIINSDSAAQYSHKAITINSEDGYFAIPFEQYSYDDDDCDFGALVIRADGGELSVKKYTADEAVNRCTYIGNYLYATATDSGEIFSFEIK